MIYGLMFYQAARKHTNLIWRGPEGRRERAAEWSSWGENIPTGNSDRRGSEHVSVIHDYMSNVNCHRTNKVQLHLFPPTHSFLPDFKPDFKLWTWLEISRKSVFYLPDFGNFALDCEEKWPMLQGLEYWRADWRGDFKFNKNYCWAENSPWHGVIGVLCVRH